MNDRAHYVKSWFDRAEDAADEFERFFFLWIALVIVAHEHHSSNGTCSGEPPEDGKLILSMLSVLHDDVCDALDRMPQVRVLALRKTADHDPGVASTTRQDTQTFRDLAQHFCYSSPMGPKRRADAYGRLVKAVRNNLFHGGKLYDDSEDRRVLQLATPVLATLVECLAATVCRLDLSVNSAR